MVTRFGISRGVSPREPLAAVGELARTVEDLGFDALWFIDHQLGMKDVYTAMTLSALTTERIEIGAGVTNLTTRHPTVTANATAALDEVSGGRALLGLGAGWVAVHSIGREPGAPRRDPPRHRRVPPALQRRGSRALRNARPARDRDAAGARLPRGLPARDAAPRRRDLRRGGGDGSGGPRVLPLAARLHPRGPGTGGPAARGPHHRPLRHHERRRRRGPGGERRTRVGDEPGRDLPGVEAGPAPAGSGSGPSS